MTDIYWANVYYYVVGTVIEVGDAVRNETQPQQSWDLRYGCCELVSKYIKEYAIQMIGEEDPGRWDSQVQRPCGRSKARLAELVSNKLLFWTITPSPAEFQEWALNFLVTE